MSKLAGRVAIVTGGSKGIGKQIVVDLEKQGAKVYSLSASTGMAIEDFSEASSLNQRIVQVKCDITKEDEVNQVFQFIKTNENALDILINNAGVEYDERIGMLSASHSNDMINVNLMAPIRLTEKAFKMMMRRKSGVILNITSVVGEIGNEGQSVYSATKGGLIAFTKSSAKELSRFGIRVNAVSPGLVDTGMFKEANSDYMEKRISAIKLGRMGQTKDISNMIVFLCMDEASYVTGQVIRVDGLSVF